MKNLARLFAFVALFAVGASAGPLPGGMPLLGPSSVTCGIGGNDSFTKVLLHFDGTAADTNLGGSPHVWTVGGNSNVTSSPKFGTNSAGFLNANPSDTYVSTPDSTDFTLGTSDFTVDFWVNISTANNQAARIAVHGNGNANNTSFQIYTSPTTPYSASNYFITALTYNTSASPIGISSSISSYAVNAWHHIAYIRNGSSFTLYIDGTSQGSSSSSATVRDPSDSLAVGRAGSSSSGQSMQGTVDEFRLSVGVARWTTNFTPPTQAYCP